MRAWKNLGLPDFLQLDNALNFHGSNKYPRSFGIVIKTCLYFGVQPVFIPISEPWRNGIIEHFNDTYNKKFFRRQWFASYAALKRESKNFQRFHNKHHRYSCLKGKTPMEFIKEAKYEPITLAPNTKLPELDYVADDDAPKSAYEIALERLKEKDREEGIEERPLTEEQRAEIAEARSQYEARVAEREILHRDAMLRVQDPAEHEALEQQYRRDRERFASDRDSKIRKIRGEGA